MYLFRGDAPLREFGATLPRPGPARLPLRRPPLPARLPLRGGVLPPLRAASSSAALSTPLILLGGITELATIEMALAEGFAFVAMARALLREPDLPNRMQAGRPATASLCIHCNKCMPTIYSGTRCVLVTGLRGSRPPGSAYAETGGRRCAHGAACSSWPASDSSVSSSPKRPTNCTPIGGVTRLAGAARPV